MKVLEKLPCLLYCKEQTNNCEGTKPYRTGSPFCGYHLREVFGIDADYTEPQLLADNTVQTHGPYFAAAPEICHLIGTIIIPRRQVVDTIFNEISIPHNINSQFVKFLENLRADPKLSNDYKRY